MAQRYNEKRAKQAEFALNKELDTGYGRVNEEVVAAADVRDAAMGTLRFGRNDSRVLDQELAQDIVD